jgi:hypothetical protein
MDDDNESEIIVAVEGIGIIFLQIYVLEFEWFLPTYVLIIYNVGTSIVSDDRRPSHSSHIFLTLLHFHRSPSYYSSNCLTAQTP